MEERKNTTKQRPQRRNETRKQDKDQLVHKLVLVRRVDKMYKGGRRMKLSAFVVVGDGKGRVGVGLGKGIDVKSAQEKAIAKAKKSMVMVPLKGTTVPHSVKAKFRSATVLLKPAAPGTGVIAGSSMRMVAEACGIKDVLGKIIGSSNQITNAYATVKALSNLRNTRL